MPLMSRLVRGNEGNEEGFYLPIGRARDEEAIGEGRLAVWMEWWEDAEYFLGAVKMGPVTCHVQAHRLSDLGDNDPRGRFLIDNEEVDGFIGGMGEGDRPSTFQVEGYEGDWVVTVYPYC